MLEAVGGDAPLTLPVAGLDGGGDAAAAAPSSTRPTPRRFYGPSVLSFGLDATDDADGGVLGDGAPQLAEPAPLPIGAAQAVVAVLD